MTKEQIWYKIGTKTEEKWNQNGYRIDTKDETKTRPKRVQKSTKNSY